MTRITLYCSILFAIIWMVGCKDENGKQDNKSATVNKKAEKREERTIVFFGNSLTAGYGLEPAEAFPALIQHKIDSLKLPYKVINAGVSGETSAGGNSRIDWILKQQMDIFVLELGANDGLRGLPIAETKKNLQQIIDKVKTGKPGVKIVLAGMQVPPNMGETYAAGFRKIYDDLAQKNDAALIPFLLEGVGGNRELNLEDGIHPSAEGQKIVAENVWQVLSQHLNQP